MTYRPLTEAEAERIGELELKEHTRWCWRKIDGVKQWVDINWYEEDFPDGYENHLEALKATFTGGGYVLGAFDGEKLVGFCSVNREIFGERHKYVLLNQIFLSTAYKRKGIGKQLFFQCAEQAKQWGAQKFYICAGSSKETLGFYFALGCEPAKEIDAELQASDENDIQLEFDFDNLSLPARRLNITELIETYLY